MSEITDDMIIKQLIEQRDAANIEVYRLDAELVALRKKIAVMERRTPRATS